jgi:L-rhamnose isomerase
MGNDYDSAKQRYADLGVDAEAALAALAGIPISVHCWQGDDVRGFEGSGEALGGGLAVTGSYPGRARSVAELRADLEKALSLIPGRHRVNLHAIYGEFGHGSASGRPVARVERDAITFEHFQGWVDWARQHVGGIDFNPTCFAHEKAAEFTLSHADAGIRDFWIEHCRRCREIASAIGQALGSPCVNNIWVPDGMKDTPADRAGPRRRLEAALDAIFETPNDPAVLLDSLEGKLFGIGSESYVVGSHEFYYGYAVRHGKLLCLDSGHFHPTESVADKLSAVLCHLDRVLLHVSRPVRWDSDHVVILDDPLRDIAREIVAGGFLGRVHIGLDYFDASINRVAAWVIGVRAMQKALLAGLLEPTEKLRAAEAAGDYTARLALQEEARTLPLGAVWGEFCQRLDVPAGMAWLAGVRDHERAVQGRRG